MLHIIFKRCILVGEVILVGALQNRIN